MSLIMVTAPVSIPLFFGGQWGASVVPTQALALAGIITLGAMLDHGLFYGLGRPGSWLCYALVVDAVTVGTTAVAVRWGLEGVAVGFVLVAVAATVARWAIVGRLVHLPLHAMAGPFGAVSIATVFSVLAGGLVLDAVATAGRFTALALAVLVTLTAYAVLLRLVAARVIRDVLGLMPLPQRGADRFARWLRLTPGPRPETGSRPLDHTSRP